MRVPTVKGWPVEHGLAAAALGLFALLSGGQESEFFLVTGKFLTQLPPLFIGEGMRLVRKPQHTPLILFQYRFLIAVFGRTGGSGQRIVRHEGQHQDADDKRNGGHQAKREGSQKEAFHPGPAPAVLIVEDGREPIFAVCLNVVCSILCYVCFGQSMLSITL